MHRVYVNWAYRGQESEPHILVISDQDVEAALEAANGLAPILEQNTNITRVCFRLDYPVKVGYANLEIIGEYMDDPTYDHLISLESGEYANIPVDEINHWRKSLFYEEDLAMFVVDEFGVSVVVGDNPFEEFSITRERSNKSNGSLSVSLC